MASIPDSEFNAVLPPMRVGMFKAEGNGEIIPLNPGAPQITDAALGSDTREIRSFIVRIARGMGCTAVIWEQD